ncbi:MAG: MBOAT family O-acyltransferase, partial [Mycoplasmatota bacterium]
MYFIVPKQHKNLILLIFSLLFYFYGEPKLIIFLILSCVVNYTLGIKIEKTKNKKYLILALSYNIIQLIYFKYIDFFIDNINGLFNTDIPLLKVLMPIGISFYTFQTISYVIDVYRGKVKASKSFLNFATYVSLFPQLVAGPIVRYETIDEELQKRKTSFFLFSEGVKRFIIGLSKKVLIANVMGEFYGVLPDTLLGSWLKAVAYCLQIYFDFSGYSDMAIGLGKMFGFNFLENFNYPYIASSITDFWRRWHMSLSSFFRDYVYIPLGGSRCNKYRFLFNILIVWMLTGFWHGAQWNFIFWGLYFAIILIIEKQFLSEFLSKTKVFKHIYTLLIVIISFVIFNSNSFDQVINSLKNLFYINNIDIIDKQTIFYLRNYFAVFVLAIILSTP